MNQIPWTKSQSNTVDSQAGWSNRVPWVLQGSSEYPTAAVVWSLTHSGKGSHGKCNSTPEGP
eukprot:424320-Rhodomonas_salina.1